MLAPGRPSCTRRLSCLHRPGAAKPTNPERHLKILHVITGLGLGGAEHVLERLIVSDSTNEHSVISFSGLGAIGPRLIAQGVQVEALDLARGQIPGPRAIVQLWRAVRRTKPDLLQAWMYHPNLVAGVVGRAAGVRRICWNIRRTDFTDNAVRKSTALVARVGAILSRTLPDAVIYCAQSAADHHIAAGYSSRRVSIIRNGIDTRKFSPSDSARAAIRMELDLSVQALVIGSVARYHPDKDHRTLLAAVKHATALHPDLKCVLAGPEMDANNEELISLIDEMGVNDNVLLLGARTDVPAIMNALDVHVTSSVTEGFPNALAEAMACGTSCISTDVGDAAFVMGTFGDIVAPGDAESLGAAIIRRLSLRGTTESEQVLKSARYRCEVEFSIARMVEDYKSLWRAVAESQND